MAEIAIVMPKMSMTMEEGTMVTWHKQPGDEIRVGDVVCEVATDKVDMEVEATVGGVLARLVADDGDVVAVGDPIAWLTSDSEELLGDLFGPGGGVGGGSSGGAVAESGSAGGSDAAGSDAAGAGAGADAPVAGSDRGDSSGSPTGFIAAMPLARTLARELSLDLATVRATGGNGEILLADVVAAFKQSVGTGAGVGAGGVGASGASGVAAGAVGAGAGVGVAAAAIAATGAGAGNGGAEASAHNQTEDTRPLLGDAKQRRTRVAVNRLMNASALVPQFTLRRALDLSATNRVRKTDLGGASWTTIVVKAYALALSQFEGLNAEWTDAGVRANPAVNVAVAVDTPTGLMVPVVRDAATKSLAELDAEVKGLAARARDGKLGADDMAGATGSVSNLGGFGVDSFNALLTPPQATALSVGSLRREVLFDESLRTRPVLEVGLTVDHRVADGASGAKLLQAMQDLLDAAAF